MKSTENEIKNHINDSCMKTIVVVGAPNCGKSHAIYKLAQWLIKNGWQDDSDGLEGLCTVTDLSFDEAMKKKDNSHDIRQIFVKNNVHCLLWAPMDDDKCLEALKMAIEQIIKCGKKIDYLITTLRRYDDSQYQTTLKEMGWAESGEELIDLDGQIIIQIPVLKVKHELRDPEKIIQWYNLRVEKLLQTIFADPIRVP